MTNGHLIVISAPSGGGKSTLIGEIIKKMDRIYYSISVTTRPPRKYEKNGKDYYFITDKEFIRKKKAKDLAEYAPVHGYWYGTPKSAIEKKLKHGYTVLLDIDVQGGMQVKKVFQDAVLIFIAPPSLSVLEKRLRGRRQDSQEAIRKRLHAVRREYASARKYDYLVINERIPQAFDQLRSIILAERLSMQYRKSFLERQH